MYICMCVYVCMYVYIYIYIYIHNTDQASCYNIISQVIIKRP